MAKASTQQKVGLSRPQTAKARQNVRLRAAIREAQAKREARKEAKGPGPRGWDMPGGGRAAWVDPTPEWRGSSVQVCGFWPFSAGSGTPVVGVPLGRHLDTAATVCGDPVSWFLANLITNPSMFILGRPGLGKSSLVRHMAAILPAWGVIPLVLSDLKPDYSILIEALGGQVIRVGRGRGNINPLDPGPMAEMLDRLPEAQRREAWADMQGRRINVLVGLCELARGGKLLDFEQSILTAALRVLDEEHEGVPLIGDVYDVILRGHASLSRIVQDRDDETVYRQRVSRLVDCLMALDADGPFGDTFARQTSTPMKLDRPVSFDISALDDADQSLQAGIQLVCWSYGSTAVSAAKWLADAGLAPQRIYLMIMDELWRALGADEFMVDRVDALTRLNRQRALAQALITHTMNDLKLLTEAATAKAWGFVERSEMVFLGGLSTGEMGNLAQVFSMSDREMSLITGWSDEGGFDPMTGEAAAPPGRGHFLLKTGRRPGIPFRVELVPVERAANDTNVRWRDIRTTHGGRAVQIADSGEGEVVEHGTSTEPEA